MLKADVIGNVRRLAVGRAGDDRHRARDCERQRHEPVARARREQGARARGARRARRGVVAHRPVDAGRELATRGRGRRRRRSCSRTGARGAARRSRRSRLPRLAEIAIDARSLTFALLVTLAAGATISLAPVLRAARARLSTGLRAARGTSAGRAQHRAQNALVVGQVALALVLLVSSGLMIRTFEALRAVEPGFASPESLQTFRIRRRPSQPNPRDTLVEQRAIVDGARGDSRRERRGFHECPADGAGGHARGTASTSKAENADDQSMALRVFNTVTPGYLEAMGIRLVAGRDLTLAGSRRTAPVTLVSGGARARAFADARGGARPAHPRRVGAVPRDRRRRRRRAHQRSRPEPPATVYWPIDSWRTSTDASRFSPSAPWRLRSVARSRARRRSRRRSNEPSGP